METLTNAASHKTFVDVSGEDIDNIADVDRPVLMGYVIGDSGNPWTVELYEGTSASGGEIALQERGPGGSGGVTKWFGPNGVAMRAGISARVVNGTVTLTVYYRTS